jgi:hypothetical protein
MMIWKGYGRNLILILSWRVYVIGIRTRDLPTCSIMPQLKLYSFESYDDLEGIWKESYLEVLSWRVYGETEETHERSQSR